MDQFLKKLREQKSDDDLTDFCRKLVLHGCPFVFEGREDEFYDFRKVIAARFGVNFYEVYIIGSAKLGFSPYKRTSFSLDSDIDISIISQALFEKIMDRIHGYQIELRRGRRTVSERELNQYHQFLEYTALGWIRPDKLPSSFKVGELKNEWFDFFRSISNGRSNVGNYKVSAGVFKSYEYLERYIIDGYKQLQKELEVEITNG